MTGRAMCRILVFASLATAGACATTGQTPRPFPTPGAATPPTASGDTAEVLRTALLLRGAPYRPGGDTPRGFDCSGFVHYVFGRHGLALPRLVTDQYHAGRAVRRERVQPGDLVFFSTIAPGASHVGIALGDDEFVHAPSTRGVVRVERLSSSYWSPRFVGARRMAD